jgi:hypothetical protein
MSVGVQFKKTQILNLVIGTLLLLSSLIFAFNLPSLLGFSLGLFFAFLFVAPFFLSAIALSKENFCFLGIIFLVSENTRKIISSVSWYWNWFAFLFSVVGVVMCVTTEQYLVIFSMLFYLIPSLLNILAIRQLRKLSV